MSSIAIRCAAVAGAMALLVLGCRDPDVTGLPPEAARVPDEQVATLVEALYTGLREPVREVIRTRDEWAAFWDRLHADQHPRPPLPAVDFEESIVVAVAMGDQPNGGHAIAVDGVYRTASGLHVVVSELSPGRSCATWPVVLTPAVAVRVDRVEGRVTFVEHRMIRHCE